MLTENLVDLSHSTEMIHYFDHVFTNFMKHYFRDEIKQISVEILPYENYRRSIQYKAPFLNNKGIVFLFIIK